MIIGYLDPWGKGFWSLWGVPGLRFRICLFRPEAPSSVRG